MNVAVGIMTFNAITLLRGDLLQDTVKSCLVAFPGCPIGVFDVGSTDGSEQLKVPLDNGVNGRIWSLRADDGNHTPGAGRLLIVPELRRTGPQIIVLSDDDMVWKEGAKDKLVAFWSQAPDDVAVVSGLLEPEWHWNTPRETVDAGGVRVLVRDSCPGAAWSFRAHHWGLIEPLLKRDFGYDYDACVALRERGMRVGAMDLADHAGWEHSTHGNRAIEDARPLDRERWGL